MDCSGSETEILDKEGLSSVKERIKEEIINTLGNQGFNLEDGMIIGTDNLDKNKIRSLHKKSVLDRLEKNKIYLESIESKVIEFFADGDEVNPQKISIRIEEVKPNSVSNDIFNYATHTWSVPISNGFGRRTRFILWDENNEKIIGLFALGDPVFNLSCRDNFIDWNSQDRRRRLYNTMDAFILGSVPPYNTLLGGKLVAMSVVSNEVRNTIKNKYNGKKTIILKEEKDATLALITTSSALGKSSIYDRIKYNDKILYQNVGFSMGFGHFHITDDLFKKLQSVQEAENSGSTKDNRFGNGPNWKFRVIRKGLKTIGLSPDIIKHGIKREIYCVPVANNYREYLKGEAETIDTIDMPLDNLFNEWKERWLLKRAESRPEYRNVKKEEIKRLVWKDV